MGKKRKLIVVIICIMVIFNYSLTTYAENDAKVVYNGGNQTMEMTKGNDLFLNFKDLVPGDNIEQNIMIQNNSKEAFRLRLSAVPIENQELLNQLIITISSKRSGNSSVTVLYTGSASGWKVNADGSKTIDLGAYTPNYAGTLKVTLEIPEKLSNQYAGKVAKIKWIFSMEPTVVKGEIETFEGESVSANNVTTGDYVPIIGLVILLVLSGIVILIVLVKRKN